MWADLAFGITNVAAGCWLIAYSSRTARRYARQNARLNGLRTYDKRWLPFFKVGQCIVGANFLYLGLRALQDAAAAFP